MRRLIWAALIGFWPGTAAAHTFKTGADTYSAFLEGAGVVLGSPSLILPLLVLGLSLSLWALDGMVRVWPLFLGAQVVGFGVAPFVGEWAMLLPLGLGLGLGALTALLPEGRQGQSPYVFAVAMGLAVICAALEGHSYGEIGLPIRTGILLGVNLGVAAMAAVMAMVLERWDNPITRIGGRVAASWLAAILVLYLAFVLSGSMDAAA